MSQPLTDAMLREWMVYPPLASEKQLSEVIRELLAAREALAKCLRLASRTGPPNAIDACNEIERAARAAMEGKNE